MEISIQLLLNFKKTFNKIMEMEQELSPGVKMLNGVLRIMVACLVLILLAIPVAFILDLIGVFD